MTSRSTTPLSEHRHLRQALRQARDTRKLTQRDVADALEWSTSKIIRIENGSVGISITDLKALLLHYEVTDSGEVERLVQMARASKQSAWWQEHRHFAPPPFIAFLGLEASAVRIKQFQSLLVPGLLQSPQYIAVLTALGGVTDEEARRWAEIRARRQELITAESGPDLSFILDESTLYRQIGDNATMREQLEKLKETAEHPRVSIQILPYSAGIHKGMKSSFEIFELSEEPEDYALLLEQPYKDQLIQETSDETMEFVQIFFELEKIALPASETRRVLDDRLREIDKE
ncbi:MAG: helix-turn-helix domain-containing protein [Actinophytocola sp.]|uniref:helix-turn-helix domain-containing protein n=1 Tax=Actinophytocola sp. TaxID=1872138 RepID=UPI00132704A4|nr:helix-turn-helix transcriptional regulator [Actinophytocola sp.]MPZ83918.1 helix-turn-helix domain-containing protein [Actinophytocola sp.]